MFNSGFIFCFFSMAAWMIDEFGSEELRQKFIPALASMEVFQYYYFVLSMSMSGKICFGTSYNIQLNGEIVTP